MLTFGPVKILLGDRPPLVAGIAAKQGQDPWYEYERPAHIDFNLVWMSDISVYIFGRLASRSLNMRAVVRLEFDDFIDEVPLIGKMRFTLLEKPILNGGGVLLHFILPIISWILYLAFGWPKRVTIPLADEELLAEKDHGALTIDILDIENFTEINSAGTKRHGTLHGRDTSVFIHSVNSLGGHAEPSVSQNALDLHA